VVPQSVTGELVCCFAPLRIEDWEPDGLAPDGVRRGDEAVPAFLPRRILNTEWQRDVDVRRWGISWILRRFHPMFPLICRLLLSHMLSLSLGPRTERVEASRLLERCCCDGC
jgi:hypothetical protein